MAAGLALVPVCSGAPGASGPPQGWTALLGEAPEGPEFARLSWPSVVQRPYQVETSVDLMEWMEYGSARVGTGGMLQSIVPRLGPSRFFRVREGAVRTGFDGAEMSRGDDHTYTGEGYNPVRVDIGFPVRFFDTVHSSCYVNNNGNITFDHPLHSFTPENLVRSGAVMIAPFWADVDSRNEESGVTRFSAQSGQVDGRQAFGVSWRDVGYFSFHVDKTNSFQLVLINRSDRAEGDFDMEFNYNRITWETGDASGGYWGYGGMPARVGWTNGNGLFMEFKGSGQSRMLLDETGDGLPNYANGLIYQSWNSGVPGRILIQVVNGSPVTEPGLDFTVDAGPAIQLPNNAGREISLAATLNPPDITGIEYAWALESGFYHDVEFLNANSATPSVRIPLPGDYVFRVTAVKSGIFNASSSATVAVSHPGTLDVFSGGTYECSGRTPQTIQLRDAYARFNRENLTNIRWKQIEGPVAHIHDPGSISPTVTLPLPGFYKFDLTASTDHQPPFQKTSTAVVEFNEGG